MRATWAVLAIGVLIGLLGACNNAAAVIVVEPPPLSEPSQMPPVDEVRLFVGVGAGDTRTITTASGKAVTAESWPLDPGGGSDDQMLDAAHPRARFVFAPGTEDLGAIVAIGYAGGAPIASATLTRVSIPSNHVEEHVMQLVPGANRAAFEIWGDGAQQCVYTPDALLVTQGDEDCDTFTPDHGYECAADIYRGGKPPKLDDLTCLRQLVDSVPPAPDWCILGGKGCLDGTGYGECTPSGYCASQSLCNTCQGGLPCAATQPSTATSGPLRVQCIVPLQQPLDDVLKICPTSLTLAPPWTLGTHLFNCTDVWVRGAQDPHWTRKLKDEVTGVEADFDLPQGSAEDCPATVTVHGDLSAIAVDPDAHVELDGLLAIPLAKGRGVAVPIDIVLDFANISQLCPPAPSCHLVPDAHGPDLDSIATCVTDTMLPPGIDTTADH